MLPRRRISRARGGTIRLRLPRQEQDLLRAVVADLLRRLDADPDDAALRRLFPPAHATDVEAEREYRDLVHDDLLQGRREALRCVEETLGRETLTEEEADAWLRALNDGRLVLGTLLDVTEETFAVGFDPRGPHARQLAVYSYLTWLQEQVVEALAAGAARE